MEELHLFSLGQSIKNVVKIPLVYRIQTDIQRERGDGKGEQILPSLTRPVFVRNRFHDTRKRLQK